MTFLTVEVKLQDQIHHKCTFYIIIIITDSPNFWDSQSALKSDCTIIKITVSAIKASYNNTHRTEANSLESNFLSSFYITDC